MADLTQADLRDCYERMARNYVQRKTARDLGKNLHAMLCVSRLLAGKPLPEGGPASFRLEPKKVRLAQELAKTAVEKFKYILEDK